MSRVKLTPRAETDLLEIHRYIYADNPAAAERVLSAAEECFHRLATFPHSGRAWNSSNSLLADVRLAPVPDFANYLVFYRPLPAGVLILAVIHGGRDLIEPLDNSL